MSFLVANRGEIAVRIMCAAAELGIRTVAVFSEDDVNSLHTRRADEAHPLRGMGVSAYLDVEQILSVARKCGCNAIHPGYGFLSENIKFARCCAEEGIKFIGPRVETLEIFGDKTRARALAERCGVPLLPGTQGPVALAQAKEFYKKTRAFPYRRDIPLKNYLEMRPYLSLGSSFMSSQTIEGFPDWLKRSVYHQAVW